MSMFNIVFFKCPSLTWYLQKCRGIIANLRNANSLDKCVCFFRFQSITARKQKMFGKVVLSL